MNITLERINEVKQAKMDTQDALKDKTFKDLTQEEKELLLETMAKMLGLI